MADEIHESRISEQRTTTSRTSSNFHRTDIIEDRSESIDIPDEVITRRPGSFAVQEAYVKEATSSVKTETSEKANGMFVKLTGVLQSVLRWRKSTLKSSQVTPKSGTDFLDAVKTVSSYGSVRTAKSSGENIAMSSRFAAEPDNPRYHPSQPSGVFRQSEFQKADKDIGVIENAGYSSYKSNIYSVNSAGNPIPLTIENDKAYESFDDSSAESSDDCSKESSQVHLHPISKKKENFKDTLFMKTFYPDSFFIFCWLLVVTVVFLYNLWIIPLRAGFDAGVQVPFRIVWFVIDAICDVINIADIVVKFRTREVRRGIYISNTNTLKRLHLKEWTLLLDLVAVLPTDFFFLINMNSYFRLNRLAKIYRVYRFYRMVELKTRWPNALRLANLLHLVIVIVHYCACIYYASCLANGFGTALTSWSYPNPLQFPEFASLTRQYSHSFHWALQEMTLVGGRPLPEVEWQYVFAIYMNLVGIALSAYVIGYVSMILLGKNVEKFEFERSMESARNYLKRRKIPKELRIRVEQFYDYMWSKAEFSHLDEDNMLRHLPLSIKEEIAYYGNYSALKELPQLSNCDSNILKSLVYKLKRRTYLPGQFVYKSGDAGTEMFIVGEGVLQIIRERDGQVTGAREGDIFGEMNIFNLRRNYRRTSDVVSCGYTELYVLAAQDVNQVLAQYPRVMKLILQQAKKEKAMNRRRRSHNFYNRRHHQYLTRNSSDDSVKLLNSPSNVQLSMKRSSVVTSFMNSNGEKPFIKENESPDSGMPPSSEQRKKLEENFDLDRARSPAADVKLSPVFTDVLNSVYQKNLKTLQKSLEKVWLNEIMYLKEELSNTEAERDSKAREIAKLRHYAEVRKHQSQISTNNRSGTSAIAKEESGDVFKEEIKSSSNKQTGVQSTGEPARLFKQDSKRRESNIKVRPNTKSMKKRTFLPSVSSTDTSTKNTENVT